MLRHASNTVTHLSVPGFVPPAVEGFDDDEDEDVSADSSGPSKPDVANFEGGALILTLGSTCGI
jgi:hypothetical protein